MHYMKTISIEVPTWMPVQLPLWISHVIACVKFVWIINRLGAITRKEGSENM